MNAPRHIPPDDAQRAALHNEVLRRPPPRMGLPVHALCVVVANAEVDLATECAHLAKLPGQRELDVTQLASGHLRVQVGAHAALGASHRFHALHPDTRPAPGHAHQRCAAAVREPALS